MTRRLKRELVPALSVPTSMASAAMVSMALSQAPSRTTMALALPSPGSNTPKKYSAWVTVGEDHCACATVPNSTITRKVMRDAMNQWR